MQMRKIGETLTSFSASFTAHILPLSLMPNLYVSFQERTPSWLSVCRDQLILPDALYESLG